ncbi:MAG: tRNA lysidine(34) synthetase TilS [Simkaniaceae bacterium]|nr:tRNA lysidine(34) synthetase TilS [Simkaniaceae bacterium]
MISPMLNDVKNFLIKHLHREATCILAFSGGPDSTALLELMLRLGYRPHLAHVDHRWRPESTDEAKELESRYDLPFHLHTLEPMHGPNLEDRSRQMRLQFFQKLYKQLNADAIVFGHHQGDQAETTLKRLLEGATLTSLGAMRKISSLHGMRLLRPLLDTPKKELTTKATAIDDPTNRDVRYLRARMREEILPSLEGQFGKGLSSSLSRISLYSQELADYLDRKISPHLPSDLTSFALPDLDPFELTYLLKTVCRNLELTPSATQMEQMVSICQKGVSGKRVEIGKKTFVLKKNHVEIKDSL